MANVKLSQIASGGTINTSTDTAVSVRSGTTDVLVSFGTLASQSGTFSGTSSGTNTGDQTITLNGDVTGSGTGSFTATIANNAVTTAKINASAVTYAKIQNESASTLLGNPTGSGAAPSEITLGSGLAFSGSTLTASGSGGTVTSVTFTGDGTVLSSTPSSAVTTTGTLTATLKTQTANTILAGPTTGSAANPAFRSLVGADLPNPSASTLGGIESYASVSHQWINTISTSGVPSSTQPAFTDISGTITTSQIGASQVTYAKIQNESAYTILGNNTGSAAAPAEITQVVLGSPGYTPTGYNFAQWTATNNSYAQISLQNSSSGSSASTDFVVTANDGTDSTNYADFGINGSAGGSAPFTAAHAAYVYSVDNELDIGALGASGVLNFYTTGGTTPVKAGFFDATQNLNLTNPLKVAQGGTGDVSFTAYSVICGGTTSTGALQNVSGVGTSGQVLTSNGASALPTWQAGGGTTINTLQIDQTPAAGTYGTLSGTVNGSNTVFTVSNSAYVSGSLMVFLNGQEQTQGSSNDWTETTPASGTFTFAIAPPTGSIIQAAYIKSATSAGVSLPIANVGSISGTATGNTLLYTNSSGSSLLVEDVALICTAANTATIGPTAQIGSTSGGSDVYSSAVISALTVVNKVYHFGGPGMSVVIPNGGTLFLDITSGATATSLTLKAVVTGAFV